MVAQQTRLSLALFLDGCGRQLQLGQVAHQAVGQNGPETVVDELGHFFSEELGVLGGGSVATPLDVGVFRVVRPRLG
jgi:hypothetical protein